MATPGRHLMNPRSNPSPSPTGNVTMFHPARCGSTVLGQMLDAHPLVRWASEIYLPYTRTPKASHPPDLLATAWQASRETLDAPIHGIEIKYLPHQDLSNHCLDMSLDECITALQRLGVNRFIGMRRNNHLRWIISLKVGAAKGRWHTEADEDPLPVVIHTRKAGQITRTQESLLELFDSLDRAREQLARLLPPDSLWLTYEEDVRDDPLIGYRKICRFIGIEPGEPKIRLRRTNPFPCRRLISNFSEVQTALKGTPHEWMLEDD